MKSETWAALLAAGVRWRPGMLSRHGRLCGDGFLVYDDVDETGSPFVDCCDTADDWPDALPDLDDPATVGCLLAELRRVSGDPYASVRLAETGSTTHRILWEYIIKDGIGWGWPTEGEAIIAALCAVLGVGCEG